MGTRTIIKLALLADAAHVNIQRWCEGLISADADLHLLSFNARLSPVKQTYRLPAPPGLGKLKYFTAVGAIRRLLKTIQPDVLIGYYVTGYGTLATLTGFHPRVLVTAGSDVLIAPQRSLMQRMVRHNLARADLVVAFAPHMADAALQCGATAGRIMTLPQGIAFERFQRHACARPEPGGVVRMITTRALKSFYRFDVLLDAARLLRESGVSFHLTLAGDGPHRAELEALAARYQIEHNVTFAGFVPNHDLPDLLAQHNLYISLSPSDGVSASLLEAMAAGLYPIIPDNPANRHWIQPGENGTLLADILPDTIAEAIRQAAADVPRRDYAWQHNQDIVSQRGNLYHNSRQFVARFQQLTTP